MSCSQSAASNQQALVDLLELRHRMPPDRRPSCQSRTSLSKASSVPGSKQTATLGSSTEAKPRVTVWGKLVDTSLSPTFAGRDVSSKLYSHIEGTPLVANRTDTPSHPIVAGQKRRSFCLLSKARWSSESTIVKRIGASAPPLVPRWPGHWSEGTNPLALRF